MARIRLRVFVLLLLGALMSLVSAGAPTFCKCTCFKNSTLIQLGPSKSDSPSLDAATPPSSGGGSSHALRRRRSSLLLARLNPFSSPSSSSSSSSDDDDDAEASPIQKRAASTSCTQCTRAFCLSQNLPICKGVEGGVPGYGYGDSDDDDENSGSSGSSDPDESDVQAVCFQRDSRKDQLIVWGFILGVGGLLGWAAARRVLEARQQQQQYQQQRGGGGGGGPGLPSFLARASAAVSGGRRNGGADDRDRGAYVQVPVHGEGAGGLR